MSAENKLGIGFTCLVLSPPPRGSSQRLLFGLLEVQVAL